LAVPWLGRPSPSACLFLLGTSYVVLSQPAGAALGLLELDTRRGGSGVLPPWVSSSSTPVGGGIGGVFHMAGINAVFQIILLHDLFSDFIRCMFFLACH
jgi:hypothetical protein